MTDLTGRHPGVIEMMDNFDYDHLPPHLQQASRPFHEQAHNIVSALPDSAELSAGLRKLLEAKDCVVRATQAMYRKAERD